MKPTEFNAHFWCRFNQTNTVFLFMSVIATFHALNQLRNSKKRFISQLKFVSNCFYSFN